VKRENVFCTGTIALLKSRLSGVLEGAFDAIIAYIDSRLGGVRRTESGRGGIGAGWNWLSRPVFRD
jgi:hypothetical protein